VIGLLIAQVAVTYRSVCTCSEAVLRILRIQWSRNEKRINNDNKSKMYL